MTRDGSLEFPDDTDSEIVNGLLDVLEDAGFSFPEDVLVTDNVGTYDDDNETGTVDIL